MEFEAKHAEDVVPPSKRAKLTKARINHLIPNRIVTLDLTYPQPPGRQ